MNNEIIEKLEVEKEDLINKTYRLYCFINSEKFKLLTKKHRRLLNKQFYAMLKYYRILILRIKDLGE